MGRARVLTGAAQEAALTWGAQIDQLSADAIECRADSHWWRKRPPAGKARDKAGVAHAKDLVARGLRERLADCARCGASRVQQIDVNTGDVAHHKITYPEKYLLAEGGQGRMPRSVLRLLTD